MLWGLGAGVVGAGSGLLTQQLWQPLALYTFSTVAWMLRFVYPNVVSHPDGLILGTPSFSVNIAPACSGYEGIGLILAFLGVYLWIARRDLQFPRALLLLPLGAATIWLLNAARIAALIAIGSAGWTRVALGGFHSQAGWLSFNVVGLGLVAISLRASYFTTPGTEKDTSDPVAGTTAAYLLPFLLIVATSMITGAFSAGFDWPYPLRVLVAGAALWSFRHRYADLTWRWSWSGFGIGVAVFSVWVLLLPAAVLARDTWPAALSVAPSSWTVPWLICRVIGYVVTVPIAEELAFRGFLPRRLVRVDFQALPIAALRPLPWILSSLLFGALHGQYWLAGTIAGAAFGFALYRGRSLGNAALAHATTNALLAVYVFITGHWSAWS
jgi:exosortase E/protease (VPEID-CTERM system)